MQKVLIQNTGLFGRVKAVRSDLNILALVQVRSVKIHIVPPSSKSGHMKKSARTTTTTPSTSVLPGTKKTQDKTPTPADNVSQAGVLDNGGECKHQQAVRLTYYHGGP